MWVPLPLFHPLLCTPAPADPSGSSSAVPSGAATPSGPSRTNPLATAPESPAPGLPSSDSLDRRIAASSISRIAKTARPALDPGALAPTKGTWDWVSRNGLGGLTGQAAERFRARSGQDSATNPDSATTATTLYREDEGPEREIRAFVEQRWRVEDGWETAWCVDASVRRSPRRSPRD